MTTIDYGSKSFEKLTRKQLLTLAYALEDQRDRALRLANVKQGKASCGFDMEAHARSYNEGYRDAMMHLSDAWPEGDEPAPADTVVEWAVRFPAGVRAPTKDRAEAEEDVQWVVDGELVRRLCTTTEWTRVVVPVA